MNRFNRTRIFVVTIFALVLIASLGFYIVNIKRNHKPASATANSKVNTTQAEWELGNLDHLDSSNLPGSLTLQNIAGNDWITKAPISSARQQAAAASVGDTIYLTGGYNSSYVSQKTLIAYNIDTDTWSSKADMTYPRVSLGAASVNGKIYAIGGMSSFSGGSVLPYVEEYNPATNSWTTKSNMPTARQLFGIAVANNKIYVIGGDDGTSVDFCTHRLYVVEEYDPAIDTWTTKTPIPLLGASMLNSSAVNNKIYTFGIFTTDCHNPAAGFYANEEYDPASDTWSTKTTPPFRSVGSSSSVLNNKIYLLGGGCTDPGSTCVWNTEYDPATDSYATKAPMPTGRIWLASATASGKICAMGGYGGAAGFDAITAVNECYPNSSSYYSPGIHTSGATQITNDNLYQWQTFTPTYVQPANTTISFKFQTSTDHVNWTAWTDPQTVLSGTSLDLTTPSLGIVSKTGDPGSETFYKYIQVETTLVSTDGVATPTLSDYTIGYHTNVKPNAPAAQGVTMGV